MKKRILAAVLTAVMAMGALTGCGSTAGKDNYTIGIMQYAVHGSLDNCREGFIQGLAEEGIVEGENLTIEYVNAQADNGTSAMTASNFVSKKVDMICAIATPCAMAAYNATMNTDIPVIYTAVSDPVEAGLANEDGTPVGNITGTSDALAVDAQLKMIREVLPEAKTIGIIYTTSEANSISTIAEYKALAGNYGFEIVDSGVTAMSEVALAAADIASKVDCITNLTDNTVVSGLQTVLEHANQANIPVFGSEVEQVKNGCLAAAGIDYKKLGIQTGKMAAKILKGQAKASEMPFEKITDPSYYANTEVADKLGIDLPNTFTEKAEVFDTITVSEE